MTAMRQKCCDAFAERAMRMAVARCSEIYPPPPKYKRNTLKGVATRFRRIRTYDRTARKARPVVLHFHAIFPRGGSAESKHAAARARNDATNALLKKWVDEDGDLVWLDLTDKLTDGNGWVTNDVFYDELHPTTKGFEIWAKSLEPYLR